MSRGFSRWVLAYLFFVFLFDCVVISDTDESWNEDVVSDWNDYEQSDAVPERDVLVSLR